MIPVVLIFLWLDGQLAHRSTVMANLHPRRKTGSSLEEVSCFGYQYIAQMMWFMALGNLFLNSTSFLILPSNPVSGGLFGDLS